MLLFLTLLYVAGQMYCSISIVNVPPSIYLCYILNESSVVSYLNYYCLHSHFK